LARALSTLKHTEIDFSESQVNIKKGKKFIKEILDFPSKDEYEEQYDKIEDEYWKGEWKHYYTEAKELVETESMIYNYSSVVELGWQPEDPSEPFSLRKNQLKGHYTF
jgi:hypothetical protein